MEVSWILNLNKWKIQNFIMSYDIIINFKLSKKWNSFILVHLSLSRFVNVMYLFWSATNSISYWKLKIMFDFILRFKLKIYDQRCKNICHFTINLISEGRQIVIYIYNTIIFLPALHEVGGSLCNSLSSFWILLDAINSTHFLDWNKKCFFLNKKFNNLEVLWRENIKLMKHFKKGCKYIYARK